MRRNPVSGIFSQEFSREIAVEEVEEVAVAFKEDLQREANRRVRRHDSAGALAAIEAIEYVDKLIYAIKLRAGSQLGRRPPRARPIHIPASVRQSKERRKR